MIGGEPYTLGLFDTAGNTNVLDGLSFSLISVNLKLISVSRGCCSQVRRIMTGCVLSAIHRQTCSLYVSLLSPPHLLKTSKRRSVVVFLTICSLIELMLEHTLYDTVMKVKRLFSDHAIEESNCLLLLFSQNLTLLHNFTLIHKRLKI